LITQTVHDDDYNNDEDDYNNDDDDYNDDDSSGDDLYRLPISIYCQVSLVELPTTNYHITISLKSNHLYSYQQYIRTIATDNQTVSHRYDNDHTYTALCLDE